MNTASCCSEAEKVLIDKSNEDEHCYGYIIPDTRAGVVKKRVAALSSLAVKKCPIGRFAIY